jgi:DNA-binding winged helix-turn-helix (wHTH) protein/tetratricopeptide (TPR) repeat protein
MNEEKDFYFGPFRLDVANECIRQGKREIRLQPKAFALLRFLVEHPGRLVTKDTLLDNIWPNVHVSDSVLSVYVRRIREALGDNPNNPRFIETAHRRGYRFIAPITTGPRPESRETPRGGKASAKPIIGEPATIIGSQPLVGREKEMSFLQERLNAAVQGQGSVVFITGQAGIGKTRLGREVRDRAVGMGCQWLEGRYEAVSQPYQAWTEITRSYLHQSGASLQSVVGPYAVHLAKIVPEVGGGLESTSPVVRADPAGERFRLFEGLTEFFIHVSREAPLVLFVDDLHWAPSIEVVQHLARNIGNQRVLTIGAYRDDELKDNPGLSRTVLAMNRQRLFHPLTLSPLEQKEVAQLVSQRVDGTTNSQLIDVVFHKTEGNPFFVEEMVRYLQERKAIVQTETGWRLTEAASIETPESVKALIQEHLERLDQNAQELLQTASVIGRDFPLGLLRELVDQGEDRLIQGMDQSAKAGLVLRKRVPGEEVYSFTHDLMQEALYESVGPASRTRYHLRTGQAMEKLYAARLEGWYDALAYHFLEGNDLQKAVEYSVRAGERASAIYTWGRANSHFQTALELLEKLDAEPRQQAEVLEKLALAAMLSGRGKEALGHWEKALSTYETLGDDKKAGAIHLQLAQQYLSKAVGTRDAEKGYTHAGKAVTLLEPKGDSVELAQAYARVGHIAAHRNEPLSAGLTPLEKGLALAQRLGDTAGVGEAAASLGHVLVYHAGTMNRGLELAHEGYEAAKRSGDKVLLADAVLRVSESYLTLRDTDGALHWAEEAVEVSSQSGVLFSQIQSSLLLGWASILQGDTARAVLGLETAQQTAKKAGVELTQISRPNLFALAIVPFFLGDWDKAESGLLKCIESSQQVFPVLIAWLSGWLCLERGDLVRAKEHVREAVTLCETRGEKTLEVTPLTLSAEIASKGGDLDEAAAHLSQARKIMSKPQEWRGLAAEVHLSDGILATCEKRWQEALDAFQKAVEVNRQYRLPYYEARSLFEWGQMHISRNSTGDRERGLQLLGESLDIFQRIQAKKMVEKVLARKQVLES